ncbi:MAG: hemolysin family protein [Flavobacteriales bacterium]
MNVDFIIILISILASAFFSAMELAFLSSNRLRIEVMKKNRSIKSRIIGLFFHRESTMIASLLMGNNIALVMYGIAAARVLNPFFIHLGISDEILILILQTITSTLIVLVTAEFLPKALVQINPNRFLDITLAPMLILYILLYVPTQFVLFFSSIILKLFGSSQEQSDRVFSKVDLEHYVDELSSRIKAEEEFSNEMLILRNALDFSHVKARDCMIPRTEIIGVEIEESIGEAKQLLIDKGLSKLIVYRDDIDNIIGYIHSFDLFSQPKSIKQILKPISFVPTVISGKELLEKFTKQAGNFAVVTDEYGGTAGIITLEDVIEEIFGEIEDEHDKENWLEEKINDHEYLFSARIDIDYLNETFKLQLEESEEYDTLAGLIIHHIESIPTKGDIVQLEKYRLLVEEVSDRKIETVRLFIES